MFLLIIRGEKLLYKSSIYQNACTFLVLYEAYLIHYYIRVPINRTPHHLLIVYG